MMEEIGPEELIKAMGEILARRDETQEAAAIAPRF